MAGERNRRAAPGLRVFLIGAMALALSAGLAAAAPFASFVMDARTGQVLEATNADTRLHPASLTKMMTLYIAFDAIERGEIGLDTPIRISAKAANEPPTKLGMKAGSTIQLRYCIRAAAIKSANDCATAIGEALSGSESAFAARMNRMAKAMGMKNTTFKVAHGLTTPGHLSTARDMSILGRHVLYDFPQYYNLFSRRSADAGGRSVRSTNTQFLDSYEGADGIKTGYTGAAGYNMTASAQRGGVRIIATVFGGTSTPARNAKIKELLDLGFARAPARARLQTPRKPDAGRSEPDKAAPPPPADDAVALAVAGSVVVTPPPGASAKTIRLSGAVVRSPRPPGRPVHEAAPDALLAAAEALPDADAEDAALVAEAGGPVLSGGSATLDAAAVMALAAAAPPPPRPDVEPETGTEIAVAATDEAIPAPAASGETAIEVAAAAPPAPVLPGTATSAPPSRPEEVASLAVAAPAPAAPGTPEAGEPETGVAALAPALDDGASDPRTAEGEEVPVAVAAMAPDGNSGSASDTGGDGDAGGLAGGYDLAMTDEAAPASDTAPTFADMGTPGLDLASLEPETFNAADAAPVVVTRLSTSGGRHWGINVGRFASQYEAERVLLVTALKEVGTLGEAGRKVNRTKTGFDANFVGMTEDIARLACGRLSARNVSCTVLGG